MSTSSSQLMRTELGRPLLKTWNGVDRIFKFCQWLVFQAAIGVAATKVHSATLSILAALLLMTVTFVVFSPVLLILTRLSRGDIRGGRAGLWINLKALFWAVVAMALLLAGGVFLLPALSSAINDLAAAAQSAGCK